MEPSQLVKLLLEILDAIKSFLRLKRIGDMKDAKNTALDKRDQRIFEEALGGTDGPDPDDKYPGMFTRERKDPEKK